jgi:hypothetical protein
MTIDQLTPSIASQHHSFVWFLTSFQLDIRTELHRQETARFGVITAMLKEIQISILKHVLLKLERLGIDN